MATGIQLPVYFGEVVRQLHELGWRPLPLRPDTKQPSDIGWTRLNKAPWPESELGLMERQFFDHACGIAVPSELLAVDIDILDADVSAEVQKIAISILGATPLLRIGMAPKCILIYRSDGTTKSQKPHPVELFSTTGQIAVFGIHAKTRQPYQWPECSILDLRSDSPDIPIVTGQQQRRFLEAIKHVTTPKPYPRRISHLNGRSALEPNDPGAVLTDLLRRGFPFHRAARRVLELADVGQRHACVRAVVSAGFNRGMEAENLELLINRSASETALEAVLVDGYLVRVLRDFAPKQGRGAVI